VPVKENTCVSSYHPPVSIQRRLCNEERITVQLARHFCQKVIKRGLRPPRKWFVVCCGWCRQFEIPTTQRFHRHSYNKDNPKMADYFMVKTYLWVLVFNYNDNPQITYQKLVKIYQWGKVLHAPHSHVTVSSICEKFSNHSIVNSISAR